MNVISKFTNKINSSPSYTRYRTRLGEGLWLFCLVLLLQMIVNTWFITESYALLPKGENKLYEQTFLGAFGLSLYFGAHLRGGDMP